ncbi:MAG: aldo/keto reductase [Spirochaetia bacterium]|nr:aldo/keto reductase [Spirochaetia bacterium]
MHYVHLGNSGLRVSDFCLGTMTYGHSTDYKEAQRIVSAALDAGITFFDTANAYSLGESEEMLGAALGARRQDVVIATKFTNPMGNSPNDSGWSRAHIMKAVEGSLRRLGTDYIDIYYIHHTDNETPLEETLRSLDDLVRQGKIRYIGCSNFEAWRLADIL